MKLSTALRPPLLAVLLAWLPGHRPLRAQPAQARIFYQPGNRLGWVPVPAAVVQAYHHYCPELAADTTLQWYVIDAEATAADTSTRHFGIDGMHAQTDARLARPRHMRYHPNVEFKADGQPVRYTQETTPAALPWLARRAVRRASRWSGRDLGWQPNEPPSLYLLVAFVEPQAARASHRTGYVAFFVTHGDSLLYPANHYRFWRNGHFIKNTPHIRFR